MFRNNDSKDFLSRAQDVLQLLEKSRHHLELFSKKYPHDKACEDYRDFNKLDHPSYREDYHIQIASKILCIHILLDSVMLDPSNKPVSIEEKNRVAVTSQRIVKLYSELKIEVMSHRIPVYAFDLADADYIQFKQHRDKINISLAQLMCSEDKLREKHWEKVRNSSDTAFLCEKTKSVGINFLKMVRIDEILYENTVKVVEEHQSRAVTLNSDLKIFFIEVMDRKVMEMIESLEKQIPEFNMIQRQVSSASSSNPKQVKTDVAHSSQSNDMLVLRQSNNSSVSEIKPILKMMLNEGGIVEGAYRNPPAYNPELVGESAVGISLPAVYSLFPAAHDNEDKASEAGMRPHSDGARSDHIPVGQKGPGSSSHAMKSLADSQKLIVSSLSERKIQSAHDSHPSQAKVAIIEATYIRKIAMANINPYEDHLLRRIAALKAELKQYSDRNIFLESSEKQVSSTLPFDPNRFKKLEVIRNEKLLLNNKIRNLEIQHQKYCYEIWYLYNNYIQPIVGFQSFTRSDLGKVEKVVAMPSSSSSSTHSAKPTIISMEKKVGHETSLTVSKIAADPAEVELYDTAVGLIEKYIRMNPDSRININGSNPQLISAIRCYCDAMQNLLKDISEQKKYNRVKEFSITMKEKYDHWRAVSKMESYIKENGIVVNGRKVDTQKILGFIGKLDGKDNSAGSDAQDNIAPNQQPVYQGASSTPARLLHPQNEFTPASGASRRIAIATQPSGNNSLRQEADQSNGNSSQTRLSTSMHTLNGTNSPAMQSQAHARQAAEQEPPKKKSSFFCCGNAQ
jgi:hypothetical protein